MICKEVVEKIDGLSKQYIKVWEDICNIESPTDSKGAVAAVGSYFVQIAE